MQPTTLAAWLAHIEACHPEEIELGLERVATVHAALALPVPACTVTVAGTNGKGSTVAFLEAILTAAGYRVGAYTSPHLLAFNERIRVGGVPVDDAALCTAFARVEAARGSVPLTYFEYTTLAALVVFADAAPDALLLEVGLGGRLDAVNVIDPDLAILTPIDLDHAAWLGHDHPDLAGSDPGVLRPGRPAVSVAPDPPASLDAVASDLAAPVYRPGRDYAFAVDAHGWRWQANGRTRTTLPRPGLFGRHQYANAAAALTALDLLSDRLPVGQDAVRFGLLDARLAGRFEVHPGEVETILDVAHNPHGVRALAGALSARPCEGRTLAVVGMLADKAIEAALAELDDVAHWYVAPLPVARGAEPQRLVDALAARGEAVTACQSVADAGRRAHADAAPGDRVVVFGSFHTVAAALRADL